VRDVENAQRAFDAISQRLNQTSMESLNTQSNVYVLAQASPPWKPSSPLPMLNAIVSLAGGLVLGVALALVLELRNRRLRTVEEVPAVLGLPVIGVLPKPPGLLARRSRKAMLKLLWSSSALRKGKPA
jgi:capsular polysaccharide biosynthesis protein